MGFGPQEIFTFLCAIFDGQKLVRYRNWKVCFLKSYVYGYEEMNCFGTWELPMMSAT
jgi:hypothetical protein